MQTISEQNTNMINASLFYQESLIILFPNVICIMAYKFHHTIKSFICAALFLFILFPCLTNDRTLSTQNKNKNYRIQKKNVIQHICKALLTLNFLNKSMIYKKCMYKIGPSELSSISYNTKASYRHHRRYYYIMFPINPKHSFHQSHRYLLTISYD